MYMYTSLRTQLSQKQAICLVGLIFVVCQVFGASAFGPTLPISTTVLVRPGSFPRGVVNPVNTGTALWANMFSAPNTTSLEIMAPQSNTGSSHRARMIAEFLHAKFDDHDAAVVAANNNDNKSWNKTQMYLYRAHSRLTWEQVKCVADFLDSRFPPSTVRTILQNAPRILRKPVTTFLQPTADFLLDLWGPDLFQEAINRNPQLLLSNGFGYTQRQDKADKEIINLLSTTAGLSPNAVLELKRTAPFIFGTSSHKLKTVLLYLLELLLPLEKTGTTVGYSKQQNIARKSLGRIIATHPHLLNLSVDKNLRPRVEFLQSNCDMNSTHIAKMVYSSMGTVLSLSVDENLKPTLDYLWNMLHSKELLRKCLLSHPQILTLSMSNLQSKVQYFSEIEVKDGSEATTMLSPSPRNHTLDGLASRILSRCPAVYSLSLTDNIMPKVDLLSKVWGVSKPGDVAYSERSNDEDNSNELLSHRLQEFPNILTMSLEGNIRPTLNFFNRTQYTRLTADWELEKGATRIPGRYIAASLYNRLLPRWHYCFSQRLIPVVDNINETPPPKTSSKVQSPSSFSPSSVPPVANSPPLHLLVQASDADFCDKLGLDGKEYAEFQKSAIPRLKFSSQFDTWLKTGRPIQV